MRCARCGNPRAALSLRLGEVVCWRHYHESFTAAEVREVERIVRQREIADAIRGVADRLRGDRARALSDRALLIHAADSEAEVAELVAEVDALGVELENDELPEISGAGSASHRAAMGWIGERFPGGNRR